MVPTTKQENDFLAHLGLTHLVDPAVSWISQYLEPDDVFSDADLEAWATGHGWGELKEEE